MKRIIIFTVIIISMLFYLVLGPNGLLKYAQMLETQKEYRRQIQEMDEKIVYLEREIELLKKDDTYLDYVIRRELGMQAPDEEQYIIPGRLYKSENEE